MTTPVPSNSSSGSGLPSQVPLDSIKVKPGDEKLLNTGWGKMLEHTAGFSQQDQTTQIKEVKFAIQQSFQTLINQQKQQDAQMKEANEKLKRAAEGQDPDG